MSLADFHSSYQFFSPNTYPMIYITRTPSFTDGGTRENRLSAEASSTLHAFHMHLLHLLESLLVYERVRWPIYTYNNSKRMDWDDRTAEEHENTENSMTKEGRQ